MVPIQCFFLDTNEVGICPSPAWGRGGEEETFFSICYNDKLYSGVLRTLQNLKVLFNCQKKIFTALNNKEQLLPGQSSSQESWASVNKSVLSLVSALRLRSSGGPLCSLYRSACGIQGCENSYKAGYLGEVAKLTVSRLRNTSLFPALTSPIRREPLRAYSV